MTTSVPAASASKTRGVHEAELARPVDGIVDDDSRRAVGIGDPLVGDRSLRERRHARDLIPAVSPDADAVPATGEGRQSSRDRPGFPEVAADEGNVRLAVGARGVRPEPLGIGGNREQRCGGRTVAVDPLLGRLRRGEHQVVVVEPRAVEPVLGPAADPGDADDPPRDPAQVVEVDQRQHGVDVRRQVVPAVFLALDVAHPPADPLERVAQFVGGVPVAVAGRLVVARDGDREVERIARPARRSFEPIEKDRPKETRARAVGCRRVVERGAFRVPERRSAVDEDPMPGLAQPEAQADAGVGVVGGVVGRVIVQRRHRRSADEEARIRGGRDLINGRRRGVERVAAAADRDRARNPVLRHERQPAAGERQVRCVRLRADGRTRATRQDKPGADGSDVVRSVDQGLDQPADGRRMGGLDVIVEQEDELAVRRGNGVGERGPRRLHDGELEVAIGRGLHRSYGSSRTDRPAGSADQDRHQRTARQAGPGGRARRGRRCGDRLLQRGPGRAPRPGAGAARPAVRRRLWPRQRIVRSLPSCVRATRAPAATSRARSATAVAARTARRRRIRSRSARTRSRSLRTAARSATAARSSSDSRSVFSTSGSTRAPGDSEGPDDSTVTPHPSRADSARGIEGNVGPEHRGIIEDARALCRCR